MKCRFFLLCLAVIAIVMTSCTATDDRIVAQVGDYELTVGKIKSEYAAISRHARPMLQTLEEKEAFARDIVAKEIVRIEAEKAGFGSLPEVVLAREIEVQNRAWQGFFEEEIRSKVRITEEDMRELYDRQTHAYHIAWIFTRSKGMAEKALAEIKGGRPFGEVAGIYSIDPSGKQGGDIGFRSLGGMPAEVEDSFKFMSPGEVSDVIPFDDYFVVIKFLEKQERGETDFESSKVGLEATLMSRKITDRQKQLAVAYREKHNASYRDDVIDLIVERTRAANPRENSPAGGLPQFSDEELNLIAASSDAGEWSVGKYLERVTAMRDVSRPSYGVDAEFVRSLLRDYMMGEIWVLEAIDLGYGERDEVIQAADREYERVMVTAFHDSLVKDVTIDEEDVRAFYDEHREEFMSEPAYNLAVIMTETREEAQEIWSELEAGANFAGLARAKSIDPRTKDRGGEIDEAIMSRSLQRFPDVHDAIYEMEAGEYSKPILTPPTWGPEGYMVVKLLKMEGPKQIGFEDIKAPLWDRVLEMEQDKAFAAWLSEKADAAGVSVNSDALAGVDFSSL